MDFINNRQLAENKLILLYIIDRVGVPISNLQIAKIILENKYMNYFLLQEFLNELSNDGLLRAEIKENKTYYTITESGRQNLSYFPNLIPEGIKSSINDTIPEIKKRIKNETLITADFVQEGNEGFTVICKVNEDNFSLMDLRIAVGTKNDARTICNNWKKHSQAIYSEIINSLLKERD